MIIDVEEMNIYKNHIALFEKGNFPVMSKRDNKNYSCKSYAFVNELLNFCKLDKTLCVRPRGLYNGSPSFLEGKGTDEWTKDY